MNAHLPFLKAILEGSVHQDSYGKGLLASGCPCRKDLKITPVLLPADNLRKNPILDDDEDLFVSKEVRYVNGQFFKKAPPFSSEDSMR